MNVSSIVCSCFGGGLGAGNMYLEAALLGDFFVNDSKARQLILKTPAQMH